MLENEKISQLKVTKKDLIGQKLTMLNALKKRHSLISPLTMLSKGLKTKTDSISHASSENSATVAMKNVISKMQQSKEQALR